MPGLTFDAEPPKDVLDYFRAKQLRPAFSWLDVWGQEHAYAFTVAKAVETELLTAFRSSIDDALEHGLPFEVFQKNINQQLVKLGWDRPRDVFDPKTGDVKTIDFTAPRRLKTIFWSNMRAARSAGQWERGQRAKRMLPYFLYVETTAHEPREEHLEWVGTILPVDDPWWQTHFPPNGWGCKCSVRQISARESESLLTKPVGLDGIVYRNQAPPEKLVPFRNRRTGKVTMVPRGIDPGWHTNAGLSRAETLMRSLEEQLTDADDATARAQIQQLWQSRTPATLTNLSQRVHIPVAIARGIAEGWKAAGPIISISNETLRTKSQIQGRRLGDFSFIQRLIDNGRAVEDPKNAEGGRQSWHVFGKVGKVFFRLVLGLSVDRFIYVRTLHPLGTTAKATEAMIKTLEGE